MAQFDEFTASLMTNEEVLAIDQDALVKAARRVSEDGRLEVWARPLADGRMGVGLFNRGLRAATVSVAWQAVGLRGAQPVRDVWAQRSLGTFTREFAPKVPAHGAARDGGPTHHQVTVGTLSG